MGSGEKLLDYTRHPTPPPSPDPALTSLTSHPSAPPSTPPPPITSTLIPSSSPHFLPSPPLLPLPHPLPTYSPVSSLHLPFFLATSLHLPCYPSPSPHLPCDPPPLPSPFPFQQPSPSRPLTAAISLFARFSPSPSFSQPVCLTVLVPDAMIGVFRHTERETFASVDKILR